MHQFYKFIMNSNKQAYTWNSKINQYEPINLIPTNLTQCLNCNIWVELANIDKHMASHAKTVNVVGVSEKSFPQPHSKQAEDSAENVQGHIKNNRFKPGIYDRQINKGRSYVPSNPISLNNQFLDQSSDSSTIDVHTLMPTDLPSIQKVRNAIKNPKYEKQILQEDEMGSEPTYDTAYDNRSDLRSHLDNIIIQPQSIAKDEYYENIDFQRTTLNIAKNNIQIYVKSNEGITMDKDNYVEAAKVKVEDDKNLDKKKYTVERVYQDTNIHRDKPESNRIIIRVEDPKFLPVERQVKGISTSIKKRRNPTVNNNLVDTQSELSDVVDTKLDQRTQGRFFDFSTLCTDHKNTTENIREYDVIRERDHEHNYRNMVCKGCGGFYCSVCKSTIPPQFRMPPTSRQLAQSHFTTHTGFRNSPKK